MNRGWTLGKRCVVVCLLGWALLFAIRAYAFSADTDWKTAKADGAGIRCSGIPDAYAKTISHGPSFRMQIHL